MKPTWDNWEWILVNKDASRDSQPGTKHYQYKWEDEIRPWANMVYQTIPPITWAWDGHDIDPKHEEASIDIRLNNYFFHKKLWNPVDGEWDNDDGYETIWLPVEYPN